MLALRERTTMQAIRFNSIPIELRRMSPGEHDDLTRFFRNTGYPAQVEPTIAWGAWRASELAACVALSLEEGTWVLRGPEVLGDLRRRGIGKRLLEAAKAELAGRTTYCVAYSHLRRLYASIGFRACSFGERPDFLRKRANALRTVGWDVVMLIRTA
ncbi:MAG TPA: GNAT family N-acetyltransferase [Usitatibacter sp.]